MRFNKALHWTEGLFLQQHHFQYLQRFLQGRDRQIREAAMTFPWGFFEFEIDREALANLRVVLHNVAAIFPCGEEISMPGGNTVIAPLELSGIIADAHEPFMVYLGLPLHSEAEGNLASSTTDKRMYLVNETTRIDEYTGKSEISVMEDQLNVRLTTSLQDNADLDLLPLMRLIPQNRNLSETVLEIDRNFIPPYIVMGQGSVILSRLQELNIQMKRRRDKILNDLVVMGYTPEMFSGGIAHSILQLSILNKYIGRFNSLLNPGWSTPFVIYLELTSLLGELAAFQPLRNWESVAEYNHVDSAPQFNELILWIRAVLLAEGESTFVRLDFVLDPNNSKLMLELNDEHLFHADEYYIAVSCQGNAREIVAAVEKGDNFRLTSLRLANKRVRGLKLIETRYPPRYFPALPNTVWFRLDKAESAVEWNEVCEDRKIVLDWAHSIFPDLQASLFITISEVGDKAK